MAVTAAFLAAPAPAVETSDSTAVIELRTVEATGPTTGTAAMTLENFSASETPVRKPCPIDFKTDRKLMCFVSTASRDRSQDSAGVCRLHLAPSRHPYGVLRPQAWGPVP